MNKERLLRVAEVLDTVPPMSFDMGSWQRKTPCGTTACAIGHYITANPGCGLRMWYQAGETFARLGDDEGRDVNRSISNHFGTSYRQNKFLFLVDEKTPAEVASKIRRFVESGGKIPDPSSNR